MRRPHIDWLRGVAVFIMIGWHAVDSWAILDGRDSAAFGAVKFMAGWAAPLFLFLAGVAVPLAATARMARGLSRAEASWTLQKRGWQVFAIAHLFRAQSFLLNITASWTDLLKPDILNVLGIGLVLAAVGWQQATTRRRERWWLGAPAIVAVGITPFAASWAWPALLHPRIEAYIRPVGDNGVFSLFPPLGYVLAGALLGARLANSRDDVRFHRRLAQVATVSMAAGVAGLLLARGPVADWTAPVTLALTRVGTMSLMLAGAYWWMRRRPSRPDSAAMVFGKTSLFVYWVHIEIVYGVISYPLHHALSLGWSLAGYVGLTWLMLLAARWWLQRPDGRPVVPTHMVVAGALVSPPTSRRAPGP